MTVTIRKKTAEDDEWLLQLRNRLAGHLPPMSLPSLRHWEHVEQQSKKGHVERYIAESEGERVGMGVLEKRWWTQRPGSFLLNVRVVPEREGQGVGSEIYRFMLERLAEQGAQRVYGQVREDQARAQRFAADRGFSKTGHAHRYSRLDVARANLEGYTGVEERLREEGIVIRTLSETGQEEGFLRKLHAASDEAVKDIPSSEEFTDSPFELFVEELKDPNLVPERVWIAMAGEEPVGLAVLPLPDAGSAFNGFTGVVRSVRGKGVARALKFKTIEWCRAHGVAWIYTANDVNNARMLSINNSLGYQVLPIDEEVVREMPA